MRVINLDETGIKLISSTKKQFYLSPSEVKALLKKKFTLQENTLTIGNQKLDLSDDDVEKFEATYDYIEKMFNKG